MHLLTLHDSFRNRFTAPATLSYLSSPQLRPVVIPDHCRRQIPRPVSYYALFK